MRDLMFKVGEFHDLGGVECVRLEPPDEHVAAELRRVAASVLRLSSECAELGAQALRARLMLEELGETIEAMSRGDAVETADGLADLAYVVAGTAVVHRLPLALVLQEVHRANMAKFSSCRACMGLGRGPNWIDSCHRCDGRGAVPTLDEHGKITKPEGWKPPDVAGVISAADPGPGWYRE